MTRDRSALRPVHLPVLHRLVLTSSGCRDERTAFCPNEGRSVDLARCAHCLWASHVDENRVECFPGEPPEDLSREPSNRSGARVRVGAIVGTKQIAVRAEVTIRELRRLLAEDSANTVLVVDHEDRLLGTIDAPSLEHAPGAAPTILRMRAKHSIVETASVAEAVDYLVHSHSRSVAVVDENGHAVGVLTDIELLRWFARHDDD